MDSRPWKTSKETTFLSQFAGLAPTTGYFVSLVLQDKQVEIYNLFFSLEDVKIMLRKLWYSFDRVDS